MRDGGVGSPPPHNHRTWLEAALSLLLQSTPAESQLFVLSLKQLRVSSTLFEGATFPLQAQLCDQSECLREFVCYKFQLVSALVIANSIFASLQRSYVVCYLFMDCTSCDAKVGHH